MCLTLFDHIFGSTVAGVDRGGPKGYFSREVCLRSLQGAFLFTGFDCAIRSGKGESIDVFVHVECLASRLAPALWPLDIPGLQTLLTCGLRTALEGQGQRFAVHSGC